MKRDKFGRPSLTGKMNIIPDCEVPFPVELPWIFQRHRIPRPHAHPLRGTSPTRSENTSESERCQPLFAAGELSGPLYKNYTEAAPGRPRTTSRMPPVGPLAPADRELAFALSRVYTPPGVLVEFVAAVVPEH